MSEIISGVPMPAPRSPVGMTDRLRKMQRGDFTAFPRTGNPRARRNALYQAASRLGIKITVSDCPPLEGHENVDNLFGVWRVE